MFKVVRNYFFDKVEGGTLRYSECCPTVESCEKSLCSCTSSVTKRPDGEPDQISQYIDYHTEFAGYNFNCCFNEVLSFRMKWGEECGAVFDYHHNSFAGGFLKNCISVFCTIPEYGPCGYFFGHLYFGNDVDISKFMNGHSYSKIVNLGEIPPDALWAHHCDIGKESMKIFPECKETERWKTIYQEGVKLIEMVNFSKDKSVKDVYDDLNSNKEFLGLLKSQIAWFSGIIDNIENTTMFKVCDEINPRRL